VKYGAEAASLRAVGVIVKVWREKIGITIALWCKALALSTPVNVFVHVYINKYVYVYLY